MSQRSGSNSGRFYGKYRGIVSNVKDPNLMGRIKFTCPDVFGVDTVESAWALPCSQCAYDGSGDIALPQIGETVWVEFEQGNSNKPVWVGNFWKSQNTPYGTTGIQASGLKDEYGNTSRVISYSGCCVVMKDGVVTVTNGKGATVKMDAGSVSITGNLTVNGSLNVTGATTVQKLTANEVSSGKCSLI